MVFLHQYALAGATIDVQGNYRWLSIKSSVLDVTNLYTMLLGRGLLSATVSALVSRAVLLLKRNEHNYS
jgi:hypothetical protein